MKSVDIVIPIYYGNKDEIESSVKEQIKFYEENLQEYDWKIFIGLNGPDKNEIVEKVKEISNKYENVAYDYTPEVGRGASLNQTFVNTQANYVCYMDVDLSTSLEALPKMLKEFDEGYDVVAGSKYIEGASHQRVPLRYVLSKTYNSVFTKLILKAKFTDAQCGFKGIRREVSENIIPLIQDKGWFWDTELLYITQIKGYKFKEVPVNWIEKGNSGVKIGSTVKDFMLKTIRLRHRNL